MEKEINHIIKSYCESTALKIPKENWCFYRDEFKQRSEKYFRNLLKEKEFDFSALLLSAISEIGGNAFDHNLGKFKESPGVCFYYNKRQVVLFDDGQGIKSSLSAAGIKCKNEQEYINKSMNEVVSGRAPEKRGNGLKLVKSVVEKLGIGFCLKSGQAIYLINLEGTSEVVQMISQCNNPSVLVY